MLRLKFSLKGYKRGMHFRFSRQLYSAIQLGGQWQKPSEKVKMKILTETTTEKNNRTRVRKYEMCGRNCCSLLLFTSEFSTTANSVLWQLILYHLPFRSIKIFNYFPRNGR